MNPTMKSWSVIGGIVAGLGALVLAAPLLITLGLWLLGVPLNWSSWKTYAGLIVLWIAAAIS